MRPSAFAGATIAVLAATTLTPTGGAATAAPSATAATGSPRIIAAGSKFVPVTTARILDTRQGIGAPAAKPAAGSTTVVHVWGVAGVPSGATAVLLNVTGTEGTGAGFVQVFPTGEADAGSSSNLNLERANQTVPNLAVSRVSSSGDISFYTLSAAHLIADVSGYFTGVSSSSDGRYVPVTPARVLDTRQGFDAWPNDTLWLTGYAPKTCADFATWADANRWFWKYSPDTANMDRNGDNLPCEGKAGAPTHPIVPSDAELSRLDPGDNVEIDTVGVAGLPDTGVSAVVLNVTAANPGGTGFISAGPETDDFPTMASPPSTSNLNVVAGQLISNLVVVSLPPSSDRLVDLFSYVATDLVADVVGYFTDDTAPSSTAGLFNPLPPNRAFDSRNPGQSKLAAGSTTVIAPGGGGGIPVTGVAAVVANLTATQTDGAGYVQAFPTGQATAGSSSNLNVERAGQTRAVAAFATLGDGGDVSLYTYAGTHLAVDTAGYFTAEIS